MKRLLMLALLAGGATLATTDDANAQSWGRSRSSFSVNFGGPYGGISYNRGYAPIRSRTFTRVTPNRYINRSYYNGPSYGGGIYGGGIYGGGLYNVPSYGYGGYRSYGGYCW